MNSPLPPASIDADPIIPRALFIQIMWSKREEGSSRFCACSPIACQAVLRAPESAWRSGAVEAAIMRGIEEGAGAFNQDAQHPSFAAANPAPPAPRRSCSKRLEPAGLLLFQAEAFRAGPRAAEPLSDLETLQAAARLLFALDLSLSAVGAIESLSWHPDRPRSDRLNSRHNALDPLDFSPPPSFDLIRQFVQSAPRGGAEFPAELLPELSRQLEGALLDTAAAPAHGERKSFRV